MKIKRRDLPELWEALQGLDTFEQVVRLGDGREQVIRVPFKLGETRLVIAKNLRAAREAMQDLQDLITKTREQHLLAVETEIAAETDAERRATLDGERTTATANFRRAVAEIQAGSEEVQLRKIKVSQLMLAENQAITPTLLAMLSPILIDDGSMSDGGDEA
jgi:hypothetical protein